MERGRGGEANEPGVEGTEGGRGKCAKHEVVIPLIGDISCGEGGA